MRRIYRIDGADPRPPRLVISHAAADLKRGDLSLLPTETVYGVGVAVSAYAGERPDEAPLPDAGSGYRRIFSLKQRDLVQTVPWLVADASALDAYGIDVDPRARALAEAFWPGALTIVVKASAAVPSFLQAADGTVALRASASPVIRSLVRACGSPLAVTSANTHGMPAPASFAEVEPRILAGVDLAIDAGETPCREASTIVSFATGELAILREGALSSDLIRRALASGARADSHSTPTRASGSDNS
ncbi:MAG: L-threonylcarbamoyladenylate synthase [Collinsella sp.]|nr:L-threonylcarbamoyladenylate synthase [Collinsella sp.]